MLAIYPLRVYNVAVKNNTPWGFVQEVDARRRKTMSVPDILIQVSAVNAALNSFNRVLPANHIRTCVANDIQDGKEETIDELVLTLQKLMK